MWEKKVLYRCGFSQPDKQDPDITGLYRGCYYLELGGELQIGITYTFNRS
jgi:hypothetical protein